VSFSPIYYDRRQEALVPLQLADRQTIEALRMLWEQDQNRSCPAAHLELAPSNPAAVDPR
jgi:hypothetical protein